MTEMFFGCYYLASISELKNENIQIRYTELYDTFFNLILSYLYLTIQKPKKKMI